jgi:hypothetical protein
MAHIEMMMMIIIMASISNGEWEYMGGDHLHILLHFKGSPA